MALGEDHGRVEADDGEEARDVEDGLDDLLADIGAEVVELRGVVPGEAGAVVAVVDVLVSPEALSRRWKTTAASVWS